MRHNASDDVTLDPGEPAPAVGDTLPAFTVHGLGGGVTLFERRPHEHSLTFGDREPDRRALRRVLERDLLPPGAGAELHRELPRQVLRRGQSRQSARREPETVARHQPGGVDRRRDRSYSGAGSSDSLRRDPGLRHVGDAGNLALQLRHQCPRSSRSPGSPRSGRRSTGASRPAWRSGSRASDGACRARRPPGRPCSRTPTACRSPPCIARVRPVRRSTWTIDMPRRDAVPSGLAVLESRARPGASPSPAPAAMPARSAPRCRAPNRVIAHSSPSASARRRRPAPRPPQTRYASEG